VLKVTETRAVQPEKAWDPMLVTDEGVLKFTETREVQPAKAPSPMEVTLAGLVIARKEVQPAKLSTPFCRSGGAVT
jgi:hypothetical protein